SGNRNFEGRISPQIRANYLASPPLVVAYALAGSLRVDITTDALGEDARGDPVYLRDIWPANQEIQDTLRRVVTPEMFARRYADVFTGDEAWQAMGGDGGLTYGWAEDSTYVKRPPYFDGMGAEPPALADIRGARVLAMLGDSIIIESIFTIPGMGQLGFEAILSRDYPVVMATLFFFSLLALASNLLSDLSLILVDPRISFESAPR
ncbi:MAG: ABC transporter permease subunit, partial [SAR324 cluster bacterium]|nr:ABC transporter permease subunit [SAR324 cluster bacterium]